MKAPPVKLKGLNVNLYNVIFSLFISLTKQTMKHLKVFLLFILVFSLSATVYAAQLTDIAGHHNETAIQYLYDNGIISGYPDGSFKPDNTLNRAELMKIVILGGKFDPDATVYKNCFPDVHEEWFAKYICFAKDKNWIEGYPDGTFKPGNPVIKAEAIKMMLGVFYVVIQDATANPFIDVNKDEWYGNYINTAKNWGILEETDLYNPGAEITRGQVSQNIYLLIKAEQERYKTAANRWLCEIGFIKGYTSQTDWAIVAPILKEKIAEQGFPTEDDAILNTISDRNPINIWGETTPTKEEICSSEQLQTIEAMNQ